ncbi:hypothetical protein [Flavobacterium cerinum]|uniref:Uncharacterized protein n=1 Tax=Flavobacterium cerinum TaxID=2502784 RepID=A0ABY5IUK1_9FLAO|nr:hypothetical protein [Flavobacterium cerinum]UUC46493.1 hypothetical protein NOX80_04655 [Flavobacterium cerinum]
MTRITNPRYRDLNNISKEFQKNGKSEKYNNLVRFRDSLLNQLKDLKQENNDLNDKKDKLEITNKAIDDAINK